MHNKKGRLTRHMIIGFIVLGLAASTVVAYYCTQERFARLFRPAAPIKHLALIMDGNRRWAKERGLETIVGHQHGAQVAQSFMQYCVDRGIQYLSLYVFSTENFKRSAEEKNALFSMMADEVEAMLPTLQERGIALRFVGDRTKFPTVVRDVCERVERETAGNKQLQVNLLFCYGGRAEILGGVRACAEKVQAGELAVSEIDERFFKSCLWSGDIPDPEVVIRAGKQTRLSNFLLYQIAYSEIYFLDTLWPDMLPEQIDEILTEYAQRSRNFGV